MRRRILLLIFTFIFLTQNCFAFSWGFQKTDEDQIKNFFAKQERYANKKNLKKYIATYDSNYKNADGFSLKTYSALINDLWSTHRNIKYDLEIKNISIEGNKAKVELCEKTFAEIKTSKVYSGELNGIANTIYYLEKKDDKWKVIEDSILDENSSILYGSAKGLDIKLIAPNNIQANTEYSALLEFEPPQNTIAIASIAADKVEYPQQPAKEVFRALPEDRILERLFTANNENTNEYIVASIGLTKSSVTAENIQLRLTGFGYKMKRVNVIHNNNSGENCVENK